MAVEASISDVYYLGYDSMYLYCRDVPRSLLCLCSVHLCAVSRTEDGLKPNMSEERYPREFRDERFGSRIYFSYLK
jgi:hypothetical protein